MMTPSETIVTILIWALTGCGLFFGLRGLWKRRRRARQPRPSGIREANR